MLQMIVCLISKPSLGRRIQLPPKPDGWRNMESKARMEEALELDENPP